MRCALLLVLAAALAASGAPAYCSELTGKPRVISGDTLEVAGRTVRLWGVDAPEAGQSCRLANGRAYDCALVSKTALMDLTAGVPVTCCARPGSAGEVAAATCFAGGYDLSHGMVHSGWALARPLEGTAYARVEDRARGARNGLWRGAFVAPWEWRDGMR